MARERTYKNESAVKKRVNDLLTKHGWFWWSVPMNGFGQTGIADKAALRDGVFLAIECKFGANKPTPLQKGYLQSVLSHGGLSLVVSDRNIDKLEAWLAAFDRSRSAVANKRKPSDEDGALMLDCMASMTEAIAQ